MIQCYAALSQLPLVLAKLFFVVVDLNWGQLGIFQAVDSDIQKASLV